jgi:hypothetical protein
MKKELRRRSGAIRRKTPTKALAVRATRIAANQSVGFMVLSDRYGRRSSAIFKKTVTMAPIMPAAIAMASHSLTVMGCLQMICQRANVLIQEPHPS